MVTATTVALAAVVRAITVLFFPAAAADLEEELERAVQAALTGAAASAVVLRAAKTAADRKAAPRKLVAQAPTMVKVGRRKAWLRIRAMGLQREAAATSATRPG